MASNFGTWGRAARGLIDWNQRQLADAAEVGVATIRLFEAQRRSTLSVIRQTLEAAGVEFTNGDQPGVRLRKRQQAKTSKT
jgi:transcriptional regulator with XRE-family HTH domain